MNFPTVKADEIFLSEAEEFSAADLFRMDLDEMSADEVHAGWSILDLLEKASSKRKGDMKDRLFQEVDALGIEDQEKGHLVLDMASGTVTKQKRQGKDTLKEKDLQALLEDKGIDPDCCFVERTVKEFSPKEFRKLLQEGLITEEEVKACYKPGKVTWALQVEKPAGMPKSLLPKNG